MSEQFETESDEYDEWFSDIELRALDLEHELSQWREARARERAAVSQTAAFRRDGGTGGRQSREFLRATGRPARAARPGTAQARRPGPVPVSPGRPGPAAGRGWSLQDDQPGASDRTQVLIDRGRRTARRRRFRRDRRAVIGSAAAVVMLILAVAIALRPGASWPPSVATVKGEIAVACANPDVASEPGQVNFACGKDTSQILWVFALMTSHDNPGYGDLTTGRKGLEPITAAQGGQLAWSLNLHHPYNPFNPVDSLEVAARAINNIIGGATLTGTSGSPAVQPGLESKPANCARYTGSSALALHPGFPSLCAMAVTSQEGRAALVADVYQQWMVGASAVAAQDVSVLFQNAGNPGDPQVQAILKTLPTSAR